MANMPKPPKAPLGPLPGFTSKLGGLRHGGPKLGKGKVRRGKATKTLSLKQLPK